MNALQLHRAARIYGDCALERGLRSRWLDGLGGSSPSARIDKSCRKHGLLRFSVAARSVALLRVW
jgi:hypothetical protein